MTIATLEKEITVKLTFNAVLGVANKVRGQRTDDT